MSNPYRRHRWSNAGKLVHVLPVAATKPWLTCFALTIALVSSGGCEFRGAVSLATSHAFRVSFAGLPNGEPPRKLAGGATTAVANPDEDPGTHFRIDGGTLTNHPSVDGRIASYYSSPSLGGPITDIGARWTFSPGRGSSGIMALLITKNLMTPPISMHLAITPQTWSFGVWPPGSGGDRLIELKSGSLTRLLAEDGQQVHETHVTVAADRAELHLPDGTVVAVQDERIAEWSGPFAVFEAFANDGDSASRVGFSEIWASHHG